MDGHVPIDTHPPAWRAELALRFGAHDGRTALTLARHQGPLRVQRVLRPEAEGCEALLLHPPGGIAGGDELDITVELERGAQALLSTPGAGKWYRSAGRSARQRVRMQVAEGAALEWLPQESILFREADAIQDLAITLAPGATCLGWDLVQLGRIAAGEPWDAGRLRQTLSLERDGHCVWHERADLDANDTLRDSAPGLAGKRVFGTFWAAAPALETAHEEALEAVRAAIDARAHLQSPRDPMQAPLCAAATWLAAPAALLLVRALGDDAESLRHGMQAAWAAVRPYALGRAACPPRIWAT